MGELVCVYECAHMYTFMCTGALHELATTLSSHEARSKPLSIARRGGERHFAPLRLKAKDGVGPCRVHKQRRHALLAVGRVHPQLPHADARTHALLPACAIERAMLRAPIQKRGREDERENEEERGRERTREKGREVER